MPKIIDEPSGCPQQPENVETKWIDPQWKADFNYHTLHNRIFGLDILPVAEVNIGPGSLATVLGSTPSFTEKTVWYETSDIDPSSNRELKFNNENKWWKIQKELIVENVKRSQGDYFVGIPDLVENLDILASLRGTEKILMDLYERPEWVKEKIAEINNVYFEVYENIYNLLPRDEGVCFAAFRIWAPGKVAKVQCDMAAMISNKMFDEFVIPELRKQCDWLDYSMFHLDGSQAIVHLESLLEIDSLNAIEWTPEPGLPDGGGRGDCKRWYPMYKKIKEAGKSLQAIHVDYNNIIPLIDAIGPEGLYVISEFETLEQIEELSKKLEQYSY